MSDRLETHRLVVQTGQHQDRDPGLGENRGERVEAAAVRQVQIEEHRIERRDSQLLESLRQSIGPRKADAAALAQSRLDETGVAGVVLDQEHAEGVRGQPDLIARIGGSRRRIVHGRGSWTTASQKSPNDRIAARNSSMSIGFVT